MIQKILIFVHSRKETVKIAYLFKDWAITKNLLGSLSGINTVSKEILQHEATTAYTYNLKDLLNCGIGIHHAGLPRTDRKLIEDLFGDGHIRLLISTATLAWGVNLPARTVIIKGTSG
jgi:pre-mRNA-splicing helicase BRR2